MNVGTAPVLALLLGLLHTSIFVLIRGNGGGHLPVLALAAVLGAWAGDAIGARLGIDPFRYGDFHVVSASIVSWIGILLTAVAVVVGPSRNKAEGPR